MNSLTRYSIFIVSFLPLYAHGMAPSTPRKTVRVAPQPAPTTPPAAAAAQPTTPPAPTKQPVMRSLGAQLRAVSLENLSPLAERTLSQLTVTPDVQAVSEEGGAAATVTADIATETRPEEYTCVCPRTFFSPGIAQHLQELLLHATRVRGAQYRFCLYDLAQALVIVHKKHTRPDIQPSVDLVIDRDHSSASQYALVLMLQHNIPIMLSASRSIMHHKFFIVDLPNGKQVVTHGSFNCTGNAEKKNWEDLTFSDNRNVVCGFLDHFRVLKQKIKPITLANCANNKEYVDATLRINQVPPYHNRTLEREITALSAAAAQE